MRQPLAVGYNPTVGRVLPYAIPDGCRGIMAPVTKWLWGNKGKTGGLQ